MKKLLLTGTVACALMTTTASAAVIAEKDKKDALHLEELHGQCVYGKAEDHPDTIKACAAADKLKKKLDARGYCFYGHGTVGRFSKNKKHCYEAAH
jgi:hypothetical protein